MNSIVHFEIPADDVERARRFYSQAFGWEIQGLPEMGYNLVFTTPIDEGTRMPKSPGAINGGMLAKNPVIDRVVITINVTDIEAAIEQLTAAGGSLVKEPLKVGDMGLAAYFNDTEGNLMGLWQSLRG